MSFIGLTLVVGLAIGGTTLAFILHRRRSRRAVAEAACGQCGYAVKGLPSFTCPECGSDLREVGIATPSLLPPPGPALYVVLWTILLPLPACLISGMVLSVVPKLQTVTESIELIQPRSGAYRNFQLAASGKGYGQPVAFQNVTIRLSANQGAFISCGVNLATLEFDNYVQRPTALTVPVFLDWMKGVGLDPDDAAIKAEAAELVGLIRATASGRQMRAVPLANFQGRTMGWGNSVQSTALIGWLTLGFWIAIWLGGVWYLMRRARRRTASA